MKLNFIASMLLFCLVISSRGLHAQIPKIVKGKVLDADKSPLVGATVLEKGTNNGVMTDFEGNFEIGTSNENAMFRVSFIGFETIEIGGSQLNGEIILKEGNLLEQVLVVGSRSLNRSVTDSPAAIDIIDIKEVSSKTGQLDINQLLQFAAPSFNSNRQTGSDGSDHVDPASLRGLGPDQTLVLINGKRRHQSSLVNIYGTRGRGNTGTDLNAIPVAAIERIEVLRDGAAAQYGSDAIAGVINIVLKNTTEQLELNANVGGYAAQYRFDDKSFDGLNYNFNANYGFKINEKSFTNLTLDYNFRDHTNRANVYADDLSRREYGDPRAQNLSFYLNSKFFIGDKSQIYIFGGSNFRHGESYAWTRFADDDRNIPAIYPNGFDPLIKADIYDNSVAVGYRTIVKGWDLDISNTFGMNKFLYTISNTLNSSLGVDQATTYDAGGFGLSQNTVNLLLSRYYKKVLSGFNIAAGAEFRAENYEIVVGEEGSYKSYIEGKSAGSQGFPGFQPSDAIEKGRSNFSVYTDAELDATRRLMLGAALRYENYSDFGNTLNGKLASRYKITDDFFVRGTISTGFRAPSLPQKFFNSTVTNFINGEAEDVLIARNNSVVTNTLGIPLLKEETSQNASLGFTYQPSNLFSVTLDGYFVKVKDRIVLTGQFTNEDPDIGNLLKENQVSRAQFFTNAVNTSTLGLDFIITNVYKVGAGNLTTSLAANLNDLVIDAVNTSPMLVGKEETYFDQRERHFLIASAPPSKINLTVDYKIKNTSALLRLVRFGEIVLYDWNDKFDTYSSKITTDASFSHNFGKFMITVGANNLFNVYPNKYSTAATESGGAWDPVQMGTNGAFFYTKLKLQLPVKG